jgi:hypothetical protein
LKIKLNIWVLYVVYQKIMVQYTQIYKATCAVMKTALSQIFKRDGDFLIINGVLNTYGGYAKEIRDTED